MVSSDISSSSSSSNEVDGNVGCATVGEVGSLIGGLLKRGLTH